jgi:uncharacterized protein (DUF697 family)
VTHKERFPLAENSLRWNGLENMVLFESTISMPLIAVILLGFLALVGLIFLVKTGYSMFVLTRIVRQSLARDSAETPQPVLESDADHQAKEILDRKLNDVWYSFSSVDWMNLTAIREDCIQLVKSIATVYYPHSKKPELEITLAEVIRLHETVSKKVNALVSSVPSLNQFSLASIDEARTLFKQTKEIIDKKGIRVTGKVASRIWQAFNIVSPRYWLNKMLFRGASEMIARKVLTSVYRIVGTEAIRVYRSSTAQPFDPTAFDESALETTSDSTEEREPEKMKEPDFTADSDETASEAIEPEIVGMDEDFDETRDEHADKTATGPTFRDKTIASLGDVLARFIDGSMNMWEKLSNPKTVITAYQKQDCAVSTLLDISHLPPAVKKEMAERYIRKGEWLSAAEGAATGMGGAFLLAADAVTLLALQLRTIQQIGYCYGFDVSKPEERLFAVKLLAEAYQHPAKQERDILMREMRFAARLLTGKASIQILRNRFFTKGLSAIAQKIGIKIGGRKLAQFIPVIGAAAGGIINKKITKDIALIAQEVYQERSVNGKKADEFFGEQS